MANIEIAEFQVMFRCPEQGCDFLNVREFDRWDVDVMLQYRGYDAYGADVELDVECNGCGKFHTIIIRKTR